MIRDPKDPVIIDLCRELGPKLEFEPGEPNGAWVLYALFLNERYNKTNSNPRFEKAYASKEYRADNKNGVYYTGDQIQRVADYGINACCSYSNWQIMYPTACELGFIGNPKNLDSDEVAVEYVVRLINRRIIKRARADNGTVELDEVFDGYNSGRPNDANIPEEYVKRGIEHYSSASSVIG